MNHKILTTIEVSDEPITAIDLGQEGKLLAVSFANICSLIDIETEEITQEIDLLEGNITSLSFHPQENQIAMGTKEGEILIYDYEKEKEINSWNMRYWVNCLKYSPNGKYLAIGGSGESITISNHEIDYTPELEIPTEIIVWALSWDATGKYLSVGDDEGDVSVFDFDEGKEVYSWEHEKRVNSIDFSRYGEITSCGHDGKVISLNIENEEMIELEFEEIPNCLLWREKVLAIATDLGNLIFLNEMFDEIGDFSHNEIIYSLEWKDKQTLIGAGKKGSVYFWEISF